MNVLTGMTPVFGGYLAAVFTGNRMGCGARPSRGREALIEHADWLLQRRERPLTFTIQR